MHNQRALLTSGSLKSKILAAVNRIWTRVQHKSRGQGLVEYIFIMAFVAVLIAGVFSFANGTLSHALSSSMSRLTGEFDKLNSR